MLLYPHTIYSQGSRLWKQKRAELIFGIGVTNFLGELGGANQIGTNGFKDFEYTATKSMINLGYSYFFTRKSAGQFDLSYGRLSGADKLTKEPFRNNRNITFRTPIVEAAGKYVFNFRRVREGHRYNLRGVRGWRNIDRMSYLFIGVAGFWFNPQSKYVNGKWYALQPLCTEGQGIFPTRKKYHRLQVAIPVGLGFKLLLSKDWYFGMEYGIRKTFTDYIDDVSTSYPDKDAMLETYGPKAVYFSDPSLGLIPRQTWGNQQRGDPRDKDAYMFMTLTLRYRIPNSKLLSIPKFK